MLLFLVNFSLAFEIESASFVAKVEEITGRFSLLWRYSRNGVSGSKNVLPWASPPPSFVYIEVDGEGAIMDGRMVPVVKPPVRRRGAFEGFFSFGGLHIKEKLFIDSSVFSEKDALTFSFDLRNPGKEKEIKLAYVFQVPEDSFISSPLNGTVAFANMEVFKRLGKVPPYLLFNWDDAPADLSVALILEGRTSTPDEVVISDFSEAYPNPFRVVDEFDKKKIKGLSRDHHGGKLSGKRALVLLWCFEIPEGEEREVRFSFSTVRWRSAGDPGVLYLAPLYFSFPFPLVLRFSGESNSSSEVKITGLNFEKGYLLKVGEFRGRFYPSFRSPPFRKSGKSAAFDQLISLVLLPNFGMLQVSKGEAKKNVWSDRIFVNTTCGAFSLTLKIEKEKSPLKGEAVEFLKYAEVLREGALRERADALKESSELFKRADFLSRRAEKLLALWKFKEAYEVSLQVSNYYEESRRRALLTWDFLRKKISHLLREVEPLEEDPLKVQVLEDLKEAELKVVSRDPRLEKEIPRLEDEVKRLVEILYWKKMARKNIASAENMKKKALREKADRINAPMGFFSSAEIFLSLAEDEYKKRYFMESAADALRSYDLFKISYHRALEEWNSLKENLKEVSSVKNYPEFDPLGKYLDEVRRKASRMTELKDPYAFTLFYDNYPWLTWYSRTVYDMRRNLRLFRKVNYFYPGLRKLLSLSQRRCLDGLLCKACRAFEKRQYRVSMYYLEALLSSVEVLVHEVREGDTLWDIAGKYYRDPVKWKRIYYVNRSDIRHPHWIYPGQRFLIPLKAGRSQIQIMDEIILTRVLGYDFPSGYEKILSKYPLKVPFVSLRRICSED